MSNNKQTISQTTLKSTPQALHSKRRQPDLEDDDNDLEGRSIIDEKSIEVNEDKVSGRGILKVRFQVNHSPDRRKSRSETKMSSSLKNPPSEQLMVKSGGRQMQTMSSTFVDNVNTSGGPQMLKAGKPRASTPGLEANKYSSYNSTNSAAV